MYIITYIYTNIDIYIHKYIHLSLYIYITANKPFPSDIHVRRTLRCAHELSAQDSRTSDCIPSMAMLHMMVMALVVM